MSEKSDEFFMEHDNASISAVFYVNSSFFTVEELYQMIKERLIAELLCDVPSDWSMASQVGRLVERNREAADER